MPEIEISEDQRAYLEDLREELAERHLGEYGTVRDRDALQFLIDRYEEDDGGAETTEGTGDPDDAAGGKDEEDGGDGGGTEEGDGPGRLQAMMRLLEEHEDAWEEVDSDQGKYAVELPDGTTEHVRTKDDVRGLLFRHYG